LSTQTLSIRLTLEEAGTVRRGLLQLGEDGQRALQRIEQASAPASRGLLALNAASRDLQGGLRSFAGRAGAIGSALEALGPAGLAAAAGLGAISIGLGRSLEAFAESEKIGLRLEAVLRATGGAAGLSADQIDTFAKTLRGIDDEEVKQATATLATFHGISGETFKETIRLASDLAAVFGGDLPSATRQLGRALEDPVEGLSALRRVGIAFNDTQRDTIKAMVEAGDVAAAQSTILDALRERIGGASAAENAGLTGSVRGLKIAFGDLGEEVGAVVAPAVEGFLARVTEGVQGLTDALHRLRTGESAPEDLYARRTRIEQQIKALEPIGTEPVVNPVLEGSPALSRTSGEEKRLAGLRGELVGVNSAIDTAGEQSLLAGIVTSLAQQKAASDQQKRRPRRRSRRSTRKTRPAPRSWSC
jgi:hypothetical protein